MAVWDYLVLAGYFAVMMGIGIWSMRRIKRQEDYFMGGRAFGKLLQTFAAFGAGTGSSDPVNTARTTFTSGLSGMWSIMSWLFATPLYWIAGIWYRRMRHLTLGDWFVERYESKSLGAAYTGFGLVFFMTYIAMLFTAIGKFAAPLMGDTVVVFGHAMALEYALVPVIALIVIAYGVLGGVTAAYWTDLIQGLCIILLSVLLIPFGLNALVERFGDPQTQGMFDGFRIMHERIPPEMFNVIGGGGASEFPLYRIVAIAIVLAVGVVVQPHFIVTGGGSAKSEFNARVGIVTGNFLKRLCTIGWALTALIILALMADNPDLAEDPDKVWGIASLELFSPGLRGLMLACLLAALMSSVDCYMIVCSALVVRNVYAAYIKPEASEKECLVLGRVTGVIVVVGAIAISWLFMDVFTQLQLTWLVPLVFAAPFWVGMYWRRATKMAAWGTFLFATLVFFLLPILAPIVMPTLRDDPRFLTTNTCVRTITTYEAMGADVSRRDGEIALWERRYDLAERDLAAAVKANDTDAVAAAQEVLDAFPLRPKPLALGEMIEKSSVTGGKAVYWSGGVVPVHESNDPLQQAKLVQVGEPVRVDEHTQQITLAYPEGTRLQGQGNFQLSYLLGDLARLNWKTMSDPMLDTLRLPITIVLPFIVMIVLSFVTPRNRKEALDRYYVKMKTPVEPDPEDDRRAMEASYADPSCFDHRKLLPGTSFEFQRPTPADIIGFLACLAICFGVIWLAVLVAQIGG